MTDFSRLETLFFAALEKPTPEERALFLESACGADGELRCQLEELLVAHNQAGNFLGMPLLTQSTESESREDAGEPILDFLEPSSRLDSLGRLGHFEVLEILGRGGFGTVFRAFDESLQRVVAVKVLAPQLAVTSPARKRFLREARAAARIRHENVVQIHSIEEKPLPYLVMEFIPGQTLQHWIDRAGPLEIEEAVRIGILIARGLAAAHALGIVHRDIKPVNILLEAISSAASEMESVGVKLTDFGLARAADDAALTQSGVVAGTPMYMSPEQTNGGPIDFRSDLFSLGSVLYAMVTGRPPFRAATTLAVLKRVSSETPRPIQEIIPEVPQWFCDIVARLHTKSPEDRFGSAREVAELLARSLAAMQHGKMTRVECILPTSTASVAVQPSKRHRVVIGLLVLGMVGLAVTETLGVTNISRALVERFPFTAASTGTVVTTDPAKESLSAAERMERFKVEWKKRNPSFDGGIDYTVENDQVIGVEIHGLGLEDLSPLQSFPDLQRLISRNRNQKLSDLAPLRGMKLSEVVLHLSTITDLTPLQGMPLRHLDCTGSQNVTELTALTGMPLQELSIANTSVQDLSPLQGMRLEMLNCKSTKVTDLKSLKGMSLKVLWCDFQRERDAAILRSISTLETINGKPCANFWKEID